MQIVNSQAIIKSNTNKNKSVLYNDLKLKPKTTSKFVGLTYNVSFQNDLYRNNSSLL